MAYSLYGTQPRWGFKKLISFAAIAILLTQILGSAFVSINANRVDAATGTVTNVDSTETFSSIQEAIDDPETLDGHTLEISNGTYDENPNISKSLTLEGESEAGVVITADNGGYGIENTVDGLNLTFRNITLVDSVHYGFKLTGSDALLENVTTRNSARTEYDFNGMTSVHLINVRAFGENTSGNGISFTNSDNITIDGVRTRDNAWGGVALYPYGADYPIGIDNVNITGLNTNEANPLYIQIGSGGTPVTNFSAPQFKYIVTNDEFRGNGSEFAMYQRNLAQATAFALSLHEAPNVVNLDSVISRVSDDFKFVPEGLKLANAIEAAADGGTVRVLNGEHTVDDAQIVVDKDVRIIGNSTANTVLKLQHNTTSSGDGRSWFRVTAGNKLEMQKVTLDGNSHVAHVGVLFQGADGDLRNMHFNGIKAQNSGSPYQGTAVRAEDTGSVSVRTSTFTETGRIGVHYAGSTVGGTIANNTFTARGDGDWLDYALQISTGGTIVVNSNEFTDYTGFVSPWGSAAILIASTASGSGSTVRLNNNSIENSTMGLAVQDTGSTVVARNNVIRGNDWGAVNYYASPLVDARRNYWGSNTGPNDTYTDGSIPVLNTSGEGNPVYGSVQYEDWNTHDVLTPTHLSPSDNAFINDNDFYFDWTDVPEAVEYEFQTSQNPATDSEGVLTTGIWNNKTNGAPDRDFLSDSEIHSYGANGTWYWQVRAIDADGNKSPWSQTWKLTIDMVAPDAFHVAPADGVVVNGTNVTQEWGSNASDIDYFVYESYHDAAGTDLRWRENISSTEKTATNVGDATYWWRVKAVDYAGNESAWTSLRKLTVDSTAPDAAITSPADGDTVNGTVLVTGEVADDNPMNSYFRITGPNGYVTTDFYGDGRATHDFSWNTSGLEDGVYTIRFETRDLAQNKDSGSISDTSVTVDNTPPAQVLGMTIKANGNDLGCSAFINVRDITVNWDDVVDADHYDYAIIGGNIIDSLSVSERSGTIRDIDGYYEYRVRAVDAVGNIGPWSDWCGVTLDRVAPIVTVDDITTVTEGNDAVVNGTVDDINITEVEILVDGAVVDTAPVVAGVFSYNLSGLTVGGYDITVRATDEAGNEGEGTKTVTVGAALSAVDDNTGTGNNGNAAKDKPEQSTNNNQAVVVTQNTGGIGDVANANAQSVANDNDEEEETSDDEGEVLQDSTEDGESSDLVGQTNDEANDDGCFEIFGICWYWWTIPVIIALLYWGYRRAASDEK